MRPKARARWSQLLSKSVALVGFAALLPLMSCDKADEGDPPPPDSAALLDPDEIRLKIAQLPVHQGGLETHPPKSPK